MAEKKALMIPLLREELAVILHALVLMETMFRITPKAVEESPEIAKVADMLVFKSKAYEEFGIHPMSADELHRFSEKLAHYGMFAEMEEQNGHPENAGRSEVPA